MTTINLPSPPSPPPTTIQTHWNFIQVNNCEVLDAQEIYDEMRETLIHQSQFTRRTTSFESKTTLKLEELNKFELNLEKIDRLYQFVRDFEQNETFFILAARINYDNKITSRPLYVYLRAYNNYNLKDVKGSFFITENKISFAKEFQSQEFKDSILTFQTHCDFQSAVDYIGNAQELHREICEFYDYLTIRDDFKRVTIPENNDELKTLTIDVELIDRVYVFDSVSITENLCDYCILIARMDYKNKFIFVKVTASISYKKKKKNVIKGTIYLSKNLSLFIDKFLNKDDRTTIMSDTEVSYKDERNIIATIFLSEKLDYR